MNRSRTTSVAVLVLLLVSSRARAATVRVDWAEPHQEVDGFGAADAQIGSSMSPAHQQFFFGRGDGQLGLSLLRAGVTDDSSDPGNCATVSMSCAGAYVSDMNAVIGSGGRVYASPWTPPAVYKSNGAATCSSNSDGLAAADYGLYATWIANFVKSLKMYADIDLYAVSVQNEPDTCQSYDSAIWSAEEMASFVKSNLGPTFSSAGLSTLIFLPEAGIYSQTGMFGDTCGGDPACNMYVGGLNWHDYDATVMNLDTVNSTPYPSSWPAGKKLWETEASCAGGEGPSFCQSGFHSDIGDALSWAAVVDDRLAVENANAWLYWWLIDTDSSDDQGLMAADGTTTKRGYMLGQYSRFVRPGYSRIDATHSPQSGVSVSAYQDTASGTLVVVATNYNAANVSQDFAIANGPTFTTLTPWVTSATQSLAQETALSVSGASFSYTLPAQSITTLVGAGLTTADGGNVDAGARMADAGGMDARTDGTIAKDAGVHTRVDSGAGQPDAGVPDAAVPDADAGAGAGSSGGCECVVAGRRAAAPSLLACAAFLASLVGRRRRRPECGSETSSGGVP
jgi:glucuronoarabinoxylan endo-1,4-beta-xylanase